jgi:hypothetical protein
MSSPEAERKLAAFTFGVNSRAQMHWCASLDMLHYVAEVIAKISSFLDDFNNALARANIFDMRVNTDASRISPDYASIVALSIRQALGAMEVTISKNADNSWNITDIMVFMKGTTSKCP